MAHEHQDIPKPQRRSRDEGLHTAAKVLARQEEVLGPPPRGPVRETGAAHTILSEAHEIVNGDRHQDYGKPEVNHARTAQMWSDYLGIVVTPRQVCMMNILQKISRDVHRTKRDNLVDIAGWAENAERCDG